MRWRVLTLLAISAVMAGRHEAYADATTEAQLRAALQSATSQIASLEDQVANLQASQAPNVAMIEALRAQLQKAVGGAGAAAPAKNDAAVAKLTKELAARNAELGKSQSAYQTTATALSTETTANTALQTQLALLNKGLASCDTKNMQLYKIGNEILDAYSHKDDLFGTIADHEPFIGIKRVQLQNIVQDDQDKLYDNQITPGGTNP
jgi:chromosome segregation ATPase